VFGFLWPVTRRQDSDEVLIRRLAGALRSARVIVERESNFEMSDGGDVGWLTLNQIDLVLRDVEARGIK